MKNIIALESKYNAILAALDHVKIGLCIAESDGTVIITNKEAGRIFTLGTAINLRTNKKIHCHSAEAEYSINNAILQCCTSERDKHSAVQTFQLTGKRRNRQVSVEISPLKHSSANSSANFNGVLITLIDLSSDHEIDAAKIGAAYKLTPSECEVCRMVILGAPDSAIAEFRQVSPETIKSQIKSILRKTKTKGRVELTRLALRADPPVS